MWWSVSGAADQKLTGRWPQYNKLCFMRTEGMDQFVFLIIGCVAPNVLQGPCCHWAPCGEGAAQATAGLLPGLVASVIAPSRRNALG